MYCPHCGAQTELVIPVAPPAAEAVSAEVRIAEINAARDIELAKLAARQDRDWNETRIEVAQIEAEAEVGAAEAEAEVIAAVLTADDQEPEPEPEPIVIDAPAVAEDEVIQDAPPASDAPAPEPAKKSLGLGMW